LSLVFCCHFIPPMKLYHKNYAPIRKKDPGPPETSSPL
jgi:hypothetical protein